VEATRLLKPLVQKVAKEDQVGMQAVTSVHAEQALKRLPTNAGADPPRFRGRPKGCMVSVGRKGDHGSGSCVVLTQVGDLAAYSPSF